jgi:hypothetical protein
LLLEPTEVPPSNVVLQFPVELSRYFTTPAPLANSKPVSQLLTPLSFTKAVLVLGPRPEIPLLSGPVMVTLSGADLAAPIVIATTANRGIVANKAELSRWTLFDGIFGVDIKHPGMPAPVHGTGVFLQKTNTAWGYFPGVTVGGRIELTVPPVH